MSLLAACGSSSKDSTGAGAGGGPAKGAPINVGYIADLTGVAASTLADGAGAAQAVIDQVNAQGGVNGHPLTLVVKDDASSPAGNLLAAKELLQNSKVMAVIDISAFVFAAAPYLQKAGVPVLGEGFDGPEWATAPYSNMFTWSPPTESPVNGTFYTWTTLGKFLKEVGVTKFGGLGYGISPSSTDSILAAEKSAEAEGVGSCYTNNSVPFGAVDFTADVLQMKAAGCNGVAGSFVEASDLALSTAMHQGGMGGAKQVYFTGYDEATTGSSADAAAFSGDYASAGINFSPPNAAGQALLDTVSKYDKTDPGGVPDLGILASAVSAQLAVYGLRIAGKSPTRATFISTLRNVGSWTDGGVLPSPVSFTGFGTPAMFPKAECSYFEQLKGTTWTPYGGGPVCGTLLTFHVKN